MCPAKSAPSRGQAAHDLVADESNRRYNESRKRKEESDVERSNWQRRFQPSRGEGDGATTRHSIKYSSPSNYNPTPHCQKADWTIFSPDSTQLSMIREIQARVRFEGRELEGRDGGEGNGAGNAAHDRSVWRKTAKIGSTVTATRNGFKNKEAEISYLVSASIQAEGRSWVPKEGRK